ncbi:MAG: class I SAM-dependent methyltransferase [Lachnospiraceae bacterium]|nr:class I SAM-dependent methyltransferase [Lachnospiraceae bacterium]
MEAYTSFAQVYDMFMDDIPYDEWCKYLLEILHKHNIDSGLMLELGCGTGSVTRRMADAGFSMIGIDNSEDMLSIAREHEEDKGILYLLQDMTEFELYGTVSAVISICDSINYITEEEDLLKVFKLVNNYLEQDGVFVFDMNTEYKYREVMGDNVIAENREEGSFIWENTYYEDEKINEYDLTLYVKKNSCDEEETYSRFEETHYQKAYSVDIVKELIKKAGLEFVAVYDAFTFDEPSETSERVYFVVKEGYQEGKAYTNK